MHTKTGIALATMLVIGVSPHAMAQSIVPNDDAAAAADQGVVASAPRLTLVASRQSPRSTHLRLRLGTGGSAPWSGPRAPADDNYQYWRQACCL
jgi:hypothetical protein